MLISIPQDQALNAAANAVVYWENKVAEYTAVTKKAEDEYKSLPKWKKMWTEYPPPDSFCHRYWASLARVRLNTMKQRLRAIMANVGDYVQMTDQEWEELNVRAND